MLSYDASFLDRPLCAVPPTILPAPGSFSAASVPVICHARHSADGIGGPTLLPLAAPFLVLPAEAALGDLQPVAIPLVPSVEPVAAAVGAVEVVAALSTRAVPVGRGKGRRVTKRKDK